ncbi:hypothetical protein G7K_6595-t1 [Saitoella complicata NRRL Y-17804]|uniref:Uncharacterized protein n=1 Tax=Saitoella complicata (strain BCRC 22490 / CBS 7301 / JCM 7358 / NBRC 10748 / NRRL Y-17804) TaxID=698492 RepID=A0A0E9NS90_SAICN|nr:hypothetical protein G7K_6595-t1 [Saitoella complicata NRRL Y-17804]
MEGICSCERYASWIPHPHSRPPEGPWHRGYTTQDLATLRRRPFTSEEHSANFLKSVSPAPFLCGDTWKIPRFALAFVFETVSLYIIAKGEMSVGTQF